MMPPPSPNREQTATALLQLRGGGASLTTESETPSSTATSGRRSAASRPQTTTTTTTATTTATTTTTRRSEKSLSSLCDMFLACYSKRMRTDISLDATAKHFQVERRRIYDIVNVLDSVGLVTRAAKNEYRWMGVQRMQESIESMRTRALADSAFTRLVNATCTPSPPAEDQTSVWRVACREPAERASLQSIADLPIDAESAAAAAALTDVAGSTSTGAVAAAAAAAAAAVVAAVAANANPPIAEAVSSLDEEQDSGSDDQQPAAAGASVLVADKRAARRGKTLSNVSRRFVMSFLVAPDGLVSLEEAALLAGDLLSGLHGGGQREVEPGNARTRRLYDVANVLQSLRLIRKESHVVWRKKPLFRWVGYEAFFKHLQSVQMMPSPSRFSWSGASPRKVDLGAAGCANRALFADPVSAPQDSSPADPPPQPRLTRVDASLFLPVPSKVAADAIRIFALHSPTPAAHSIHDVINTWAAQVSQECERLLAKRSVVESTEQVGQEYQHQEQDQEQGQEQQLLQLDTSPPAPPARAEKRRRVSPDDEIPPAIDSPPAGSIVALPLSPDRSAISSRHSV